MKERYKYIEPAPATENPEPSVKKTTPTAPLTEFVPALRYVEKATGNIYQTFTDKIDERKFSSTVIPRVYEAFFGDKGQSVVMRYLKNDRIIETFLGSLPKELLGGDTADNNEIKGTFLPENITDLSLSADALKLFYLFDASENTAVGITTTMSGASKSQIFDSAFTEWLSSWPNPNLITLNTKPSSRVLGYMYGLDPSKKTLTKMLGEVYGLTTLTSPNGKIILYGNNTLTLRAYDTETRSSIDLGLKTLPEKCTWLKTNDFVYCSVPKNVPPGEYPDSWYKGEVSFSDSIWKINITNSNATLIMDPMSAIGGENMDGIKLTVDDNEDSLFYVNKKDSYLWQVKLR